uniref:valine--tRNA ligase n=1 Tax=Panagrellus redivivus TaxID=6233 RepID=A0A7E4UYJ0_PANRE
MRVSLHRRSGFSVDTVVRSYREGSGKRPRIAAGGEPFRMILPPPNVTGNLHLGHASTVVIQDAICRYQRHLGRDVTWFPGFDHAGIATQTVVERKLFKEKGLLRADMDKDEFLRHCNEWKDSRIASITSQLQRTGASLAEDQSYYTMDERFSEAVTHAFCQLHSDGLIFRDKRIINWCSTLRSAISDQEVDFISIEGRQGVPFTINGRQRHIEFGALHLVRYALVDPIPGEKVYVEVATTRPETLFADMALAINPNDPNNSKYIGRRVKHPLTGTILPIIADEGVKLDKGTGLLKVTPSHDFLDYTIAKRHPEVFKDDYLSCIDESGFLINANSFNSQHRLAARENVVSALAEQNVYGGFMEQPTAQIPVCSRTGDFIEPKLHDQWFLDCQQLNATILDDINNGRISIFPEGNIQKLVDWLSYSEPWCLSRQLAWGHQIPAFKKADGSWVVSATPVPDSERDSDVLDTWFSSALIPLIVNGWPNKDVKFTSPPLNLMETGHDIIGFWVARMLILCRHLGGVLPFDKILLHGLIRDSNGRKMSKSLGNVIDPLDVIDGISLSSMVERLRESNLDPKEIVTAEKDLKTRFPEGMKAAGPDGLRFALLRHDLFSEDVNASIATTAQEGLKFCNKLWNLDKYAEIVYSKVDLSSVTDPPLAIADQWIISRLRSTLERVYDLMDAKNDCATAAPHLAFGCLKDFLLQDLCDVYLETTKSAINDDNSPDVITRRNAIAFTLQRVLSVSFTVLEPFMPFVSTYLGQKQPGDIFNAINVFDEAANLPKNTEAEQNMAFTLAVVSAVRSIRAALDLPRRFRLIGSLQSETSNAVDVVLEELVNLQLDSSLDAEHSMPVAVPGRDAVLYVQIEESQREDLIARLNQQVDRALHREELLQRTLDKSVQMLQQIEANEKSKPPAIQKAVRRVRQTESSLDSAKNEVTRLRKIVDQIN